MIRVTVLFPTTGDSRFDMGYYLTTHTSLVTNQLKKHGLLTIEIDEAMGGIAPAEPAPYAVVCTLTFENLEGFQAGLAAHGAEIMGDIANFTNVQPIIQFGRVAKVP